MKLHVSFDDDLMKRYVERESSPLFKIYWTHDGVAYPEEQWMDFGSVLLSWWLVAAKSLLAGAAEADLPFMDGPFYLRAHRIGNVLYISADDHSWQWQMSLDEFVIELLRAADKAQQKFAELNIPDRQGLKVGVQQLKIAASQAKTNANTNRAFVAGHVS